MNPDEYVDRLLERRERGPQDRARAQIDQLQSALVDLRTVVTAGHADDAIRLALSSVAATTHDSRGAVASLPLHARGRRTSWIFVCDTGPGIPAGLEQRIFDPFFTTKEVGAGTGLGLSITYGIIKERQGTIAVENRLDEGALFLIQLPLEQ